MSKEASSTGQTFSLFPGFVANEVPAEHAKAEVIYCIRCSSKWEPQGGWNFHDLCTTCFKDYDRQKMEGRFAWVAHDFDPSKRPSYYESSNEWAAATKSKANKTERPASSAGTT